MKLFSEVRERLRVLFFRAREERELDEELRFHVEMETEANLRRGMNPGEARRQAMIAFGGVERFKEEVRDARNLGLLEDLWRDLRFAFRRLIRERGFSIPAIATLAVGIGVTAAVFALVNAVLIQPLPYADANRLVAVGHTASGEELAETGLSTGTFLHYREYSRVLEDVGVYVEKVFTVTDPGAPEQVGTALASPSLFSVLRATPYLGRLPTADLELGGPNEVLISHDLWVRRYGADPGIIGRTIEIERERDVVVGVAEPGFHFPNPETQVWIGWSLEALVAAYGPSSGVRNLYMSGIARLKDGIAPEAAERELQRLVRSLPDAYPDITPEELQEMGLRAVIVPFKNAIIADVRMPLLLLLATAGFLLLITWANVANLSLVRAERQRREVAVARALGATGGHLARRFLTESFLLAAVGGTVGLALAYVAVEVRFGFEPEQIPRLHNVGVNGAVLGLTLGLSIFTGVLLGAVSLLSARRADLAGALTGALGRMTASRREQTGRRLLVAGQVALLALAGIGVGLLAAFALTRFLGSLLYEVSPSNPVAFAAMAALLFAVALAASYLPARRAGRIDPAGALRAE